MRNSHRFLHGQQAGSGRGLRCRPSTFSEPQASPRSCEGRLLPETSVQTALQTQGSAEEKENQKPQPCRQGGPQSAACSSHSLRKGRPCELCANCDLQSPEQTSLQRETETRGSQGLGMQGSGMPAAGVGFSLGEEMFWNAIL